MSGIAQEEVTKLSKRIKFGHRQSIKKWDSIWQFNDIWIYKGKREVGN